MCIQSSVAKATLVIFVSGLLASFVVKYINKYLGRYVCCAYGHKSIIVVLYFQITYFLGLCILWGAM